MATTDTHSIYARLADGRIVRLGDKGLDWHVAQAKWKALDDARIEGRLPCVDYLVVRADDDPDPRWAKAKRLTGVYLPGHVFRDMTSAGRAIAKEKGLVGREGGWLYNRRGEPVTQGYASLVRGAQRSSVNAGRSNGRYVSDFDPTVRGYVLKVGLGFHAAVK